MSKRTLWKKVLMTLAVAALAALPATPVAAATATAVRTLPSSVAAGAQFDVDLDVDGCGSFGQVVETLPDGFSYVGCSSPDVGVEVLGNTVKFTFLGGSVSFSYTVTASTVPATYTFEGIIKDADLSQSPVTGGTAIEVREPEPAAERSLPGSVNSGAEFEVDIDASGCGSFGQVIETLPAGFSYVSCSSPDIGVEIVGSDVKFTFLGDEARFSYEVEAPRVAADTVYTFTGLVKGQDRLPHAMGDDDLEVTAPEATRTFPLQVLSGAEFEVEIDASGCGSFGQVVETLPSGFSYLDSSLPDGQVEQLGNTVKFTFLGDSESFTYDVEAPTVDATELFTFTGELLDDNRDSYPIEDDDISVAAIYTLTVTCSPAGGGDVALNPEDQDPGEPGAQYEDGTTVALTAGPAANYRFDHWSGNLTGTDPTMDVTMTTDLSVTAHFTPTEGAIGGEGSFPSATSLLAPWIALGVFLLGGLAFLATRRRAEH